jgi:tRNA (guanine10-N2)-dimethyltransferase
MILGSTKNLKSASLMLADATHLPLSDHSIDTVVTDFPYGQSVCIRKTDSMDQLYAASLEEIRRVVKPGRRAVVVTHRDISAIAAGVMTILEQHEQRVHKSLTRRVLVLGH